MEHKRTFAHLISGLRTNHDERRKNEQDNPHKFCAPVGRIGAGTGSHSSCSERVSHHSGGVAAAGDGDIVMVMEGTYFENISFGGKNFDVLSLKVSDRQ
jgi:hypothetical protein